MRVNLGDMVHKILRLAQEEGKLTEMIVEF